MQTLHDFTDTIVWPGSSLARVQCLLVENQHKTTLTAQRIIHDHMVYHEFESSNSTITAKLLSHVMLTCPRYFNNQKERPMQKVQSDRNIEMKQINYDIGDANKNIRHLQDTVKSLKTSVKSTISEIKNLISKSNVQKCAATEKWNLLDSAVMNWHLLIEKKDEL